ncbi:hypothetical protein RclHR1_01410025 [Rhizophagus clarus]|uniref:Uncharacterized protein n=1 Tax=Rhizophagus clarus TaxID=94130 RepID=A0A2Z6QG84_9GLOM|nr:hypothetical protein RclHR1_01410025 [Rhizophagus clarus]
METTLTAEKFRKQLQLEVERTFVRNFRNIGSLSQESFFDRVDKRFGKPRKHSASYFRKLGDIAGLDSAIIELVFRSVEDVAINIYREDIIRLGKNTEQLRSWFHEAQRKSHDITSQLTKKETEVKCKERIIQQKDEKISRLGKLN